MYHEPDFGLEYINPSMQAPIRKRRWTEMLPVFQRQRRVCPWCNNKEVFGGKTVSEGNTVEQDRKNL